MKAVFEAGRDLDYWANEPGAYRKVLDEAARLTVTRGRLTSLCLSASRRRCTVDIDTSGGPEYDFNTRRLFSGQEMLNGAGRGQ